MPRCTVGCSLTPQIQRRIEMRVEVRYDWCEASFRIGAITYCGSRKRKLKNHAAEAFLAMVLGFIVLKFCNIDHDLM